MTDPNPFNTMMKMGQDWAKAMNPALESFTPKGFEAMFPTMPKDLMETFMGKGISPDGLDAKTRLLLTLAALTMLGAQAEAGATKQEIAETIAQMGMFAGVPAMTKAMELATEVFEKDESA